VKARSLEAVYLSTSADVVPGDTPTAPSSTQCSNALLNSWTHQSSCEVRAIVLLMPIWTQSSWQLGRNSPARRAHSFTKLLPFHSAVYLWSASCSNGGLLGFSSGQLQSNRVGIRAQQANTGLHSVWFNWDHWLGEPWIAQRVSWKEPSTARSIESRSASAIHLTILSSSTNDYDAFSSLKSGLADVEGQQHWSQHSDCTEGVPKNEQA
jgi:hypothetical protein